MSLNVLEKLDGEVAVLETTGFIDTSTASVLENNIKRLHSEKKIKIVVDLRGTEFISSAGWGVFVAYLRKIRGEGGDLRLASMIDKVAKVYTLMEFDSLIDSFPTVREAVESFRQ
jgi:anti-sigma B factor antagonist